MQMDGQEVFKFAVKKVPEIVNAILEETGTDREAVQHYLLHQANIRILEAASRRLKVPMDKIPVNIERYGNTSAASIPILLDEMHRDGRLKRRYAGDGRFWRGSYLGRGIDDLVGAWRGKKIYSKTNVHYPIF